MSAYRPSIKGVYVLDTFDDVVVNIIQKICI